VPVEGVDGESRILVQIWSEDEAAVVDLVASLAALVRHQHPPRVEEPTCRQVDIWQGHNVILIEQPTRVVPLLLLAIARQASLVVMFGLAEGLPMAPTWLEELVVGNCNDEADEVDASYFP
jgi:hypothetical protein